MTLAVLSDIHGNMPALRAVLAEASREGVDRVLVLGDLFGPLNVHNVLEELRAVNAFVVRGNGERYQLHDKANWEGWDQFAAPRAVEQELGAQGLRWIAALPVQASLEYEGVSLRLVHGSPRGDSDALKMDDRPALHRALRMADETILLCGHTHRAFVYAHSGRYIVNVGSVGMNRNADSTADWTLLTIGDGDARIEQRRAAYDFAERRRTAGDLPWAMLTMRGIETGQDLFWRFLNEARERGGGKWPIPNEAWRGVYGEWAEKGWV